MPLHRFRDERVSLLRWPGGLTLAPRDLPGGAEVLLLEGRLVTNHGELTAGSWLRLPPGARLEAATAVEDARVYLKLGHLAALAGARHRVDV
jgi:hypothetical protein